MREGGAILAGIRTQVIEVIEPGITLEEIDGLADNLIRKSGGKASFKLVPGYQHATCINVNQGVVHGIPTKQKIKKGDVVSVDIGLFYDGFHTDAATTTIAGKSTKKNTKLLLTGKKALKKAINKAIKDNKVIEISKSIQQSIEKPGFSCARTLTGHGVGKKLHEEPTIPCIATNNQENSPKLKAGQTLAIEVIYMQGSSDIVVEKDGWTISTKDGQNASVFEETVLVTSGEPEILTKKKNNKN